MTQDLLSMWPVIHDLAGEMAEMEGVMLKDNVWKDLSHVERIYYMVRRQGREVEFLMLTIEYMYIRNREFGKGVR